MIRRALISAVLGLILTLSGHVAEAGDAKPAPLALKLSGNVGRAESDVIVRMRVQPDQRARELLVEWVGDDLSGGSHVIALDGARAAISYQYSIKGLPEGVYVVKATLRFNDGSEARQQANLIMVGGDSSSSTASLAHGAMRH